MRRQTAMKLLLGQRANNGPTAVASGPASTPSATDAINLTGTASTDPDGAVLRYKWELISGPRGGTFSTQGSTTTFTPNP